MHSILTEMTTKLQEKISEKSKMDEMLNLTKSKIISILNSMNADELIPKKEFKSEQDFKNHILSIIQKVRNKLFEEMKNTFDEE